MFLKEKMHNKSILPQSLHLLTINYVLVSLKYDSQISLVLYNVLHLFTKETFWQSGKVIHTQRPSTGYGKSQKILPPVKLLGSGSPTFWYSVDVHQWYFGWVWSPSAQSYSLDHAWTIPACQDLRNQLSVPGDACWPFVLCC